MPDKIKQCQNELKKGILPRREFIKLATAAGIASTALGSLLSSNAHAQTPKHGGRLTVGVESAQQSNSIDPAKYYSDSDLLRGFALYDTLVNQSPELLPTPQLAVSWEPNADASKWVFKLRKGVQFHNGKSFGADDVIYSLQHHLGEKSESPAKAYLSQIKGMKKSDEHTLEFTLVSPNAHFPLVLSDTRTHIFSDGYTDFSRTTNGTGPFKIKKFKPGSTYIFERNPNYWGSTGPYVDEIEYIGIADPTARVNALLSGDIDLMMQLDPKAAHLIDRNKDFTLLRAKSRGLHSGLVMMEDRRPTSDKNLRLAMKYGIDREMILKNVYKGYGDIGNDHPIAPTDPYYNSHIPQYTYDPDKAKHYIKKAGMDKKPLDIYSSSVTGVGSNPSCEIFQETARAGDININLHKVSADSYWETAWMQKPMCTTTWPARPIPDLMFSIAYKGDAKWNETAWKNDHFDKLLLEARSEKDFDKSKELYGEMQKMLHDDGGIIILAFMDNLDASSKKVKGITPHSSGPLGFNQFATTVWIDS
ncbi:MAG: peptide ABC transporter substrate-binding protein [Thiothrix sp.]|nr:MAG: peptide ABC transporter substrate-binding protein [Thiothrix sp.]